MMAGVAIDILSVTVLSDTLILPKSLLDTIDTAHWLGHLIT